jgi:Pro-kumamolisin, activation domain
VQPTVPLRFGHVFRKLRARNALNHLSLNKQATLNGAAGYERKGIKTYSRGELGSIPSKMLWASLLVLGLVQLGTSKIHLKRWDNLAVKHSWPEIPRGWKYKAPAPADYVFELRIGLKQDRIDDLIDNLMEISDPSHARYIVYFYGFHS